MGRSPTGSQQTGRGKENSRKRVNKEINNHKSGSSGQKKTRDFLKGKSPRNLVQVLLIKNSRIQNKIIRILQNRTKVSFYFV